ncbi:MAG: hypothetical protein JNK29_18520 [Anaerolineales bacterium]|nr:hypothetical protein [Anaerolineales bacterium]
MHILFIFLDGVGLGADDPAHNPLAAAELPVLTGLLGGRRLLADTPRLETERALFIPADACLGVEGVPQSATGQAAILTGRNAPREVGGHWGPKPNAAVAALIERESLLARLAARGRRAALLSAYPPGYFTAIGTRRRNYSAVPLAFTRAGYRLMDLDDLRAGQAFSVDFTGHGWQSELKIPDVPVLDPRAAGRQLAQMARQYHFAFFEHWLTDVLGHRGTLAEGVRLLERLDAVLGGVLEAWDDEAGLLILTSDHGNLEDLRHRHHTRNAVPALAVGRARAALAGLTDLTGFAPAILGLLDGPSAPAAVG